MITPAGLLLIFSPYTWLEEYTPKQNWLGDKRENGKALTTYQALQRLLVEHFAEACAPADIPFATRETARQYQHTICPGNVLAKKGLTLYCQPGGDLI